MIINSNSNFPFALHIQRIVLFKKTSIHFYQKRNTLCISITYRSIIVLNNAQHFVHSIYNKWIIISMTVGLAEE